MCGIRAVTSHCGPRMLCVDACVRTMCGDRRVLGLANNQLNGTLGGPTLAGLKGLRYVVLGAVVRRGLGAKA